jgi:membrane protein
MWPKDIWKLISATASEWSEDRVSRMAASLAFYTVFSIAPMLVIAVWVAGQVFDQEAVAAEVSAQLRLLMGPMAARAVESMLITASAQPDGGWTATILGVGLLVYTSTNVFAELQDSMNTIWEVKARPGKLWWQMVRDRLVSFAMVLGIAFLLMVSLLLSTALAALSRYISGGAEFWSTLNNLLSLVVFTGVFGLMLKYLPDVKIGWPDVLIGAIVTSALFTLGKFLIAYYLGRESVSSVYGAAGSLAILLLWVYYSAQIVYIGAEFTQVYTRWRRGRKRVEPERGAVDISEEERVQQGIPHQATVDGAAEKQAVEERQR